MLSSVDNILMTHTSGRPDVTVQCSTRVVASLSVDLHGVSNNTS